MNIRKWDPQTGKFSASAVRMMTLNFSVFSRWTINCEKYILRHKLSGNT